jgi:phosphoglycolate phosphatase
MNTSTPPAFKTIIWDFNGTLIDDLDLVVRCVNEQLARRDLPLLTTSSYRSVFGFPVEDYYRRIGLNPDKEPMADLSAEFFSAYDRGLETCNLYSDAFDTLERLSAIGCAQFVLSAMEEDRLRSTVAHLGIAGFFAGVYGLSHLEGDSKLSRGQDLLNDFDIDPHTAVLVGDTDHDAEVAVALGVFGTLIAQGHQSLSRLQDTGRPVYPSLRVWMTAVDERLDG